MLIFYYFKITNVYYGYARFWASWVCGLSPNIVSMKGCSENPFFLS